MPLDILVYRLARLWKVIVFGCLAPLATVLAASVYHGADFPALLALALLIPTAHVLRYPGMWQETLAVALVLSLCLFLAAMMEPELTTGAILSRIFWLFVLALILFLVLVSPLSLLVLAGPKRVLTARATRCSPLAAETLRAAITLYPGKSDVLATCGPADEDGRFPITLNLQEVAAVKYAVPGNAAFEGPDEDAPLPCDEAPADFSLQAVVHESTTDRHEIFTYVSPDEVGVQRHLFRDLGENGTEVTIEETGHLLTWGQIFGFWLSGYMADHLTHVLDMAEGRAPRANRAFPQKQLVVDIANLVLPLLGGRRVENSKT